MDRNEVICAIASGVASNSNIVHSGFDADEMKRAATEIVKFADAVVTAADAPEEAPEEDEETEDTEDSGE